MHQQKGHSFALNCWQGVANVLCKRLITHIVERIFPETQCGFRPDRSTADMIFDARQFFEKHREQH